MHALDIYAAGVLSRAVALRFGNAFKCDHVLRRKTPLRCNPSNGEWRSPFPTQRWAPRANSRYAFLLDKRTAYKANDETANMLNGAKVRARVKELEGQTCCTQLDTMHRVRSRCPWACDSIKFLALREARPYAKQFENTKK